MYLEQFRFVSSGGTDEDSQDHLGQLGVDKENQVVCGRIIGSPPNLGCRPAGVCKTASQSELSIMCEMNTKPNILVGIL